MKYKAAIYLPTYNRPHLIQEAVNSVIGQSAKFPYLLWLYVNSPKEDSRTIEKILEYGSPEIDKLKIVIDPRQEGINHYVKGFNRFIEEVDAEYMFNFQDDDLLHRDFVNDMVAELETGKDAVYCGRQHTHKDGSVEIYTNNQIYSQANSAVGSMEITMLGVRREILLGFKKPYIEDFSVSNQAGIVKMMYEFIRGIEQQTNIYPVLDKQFAKLLYFQRTFENSTWQPH